MITALFIVRNPFNHKKYPAMAENNGVFSDLFNAAGNTTQNLAENVLDGASNVTGAAQEYANLGVSLATGITTTALKIMQDVLSGISSALTPKQ
jgi:chlorosome envelope protein F